MLCWNCVMRSIGVKHQIQTTGGLCTFDLNLFVYFGDWMDGVKEVDEIVPHCGFWICWFWLKITMLTGRIMNMSIRWWVMTDVDGIVMEIFSILLDLFYHSVVSWINNELTSSSSHRPLSSYWVYKKYASAGEQSSSSRITYYVFNLRAIN